MSFSDLKSSMSKRQTESGKPLRRADARLSSSRSKRARVRDAGRDVDPRHELLLSPLLPQRGDENCQDGADHQTRRRIPQRDRRRHQGFAAELQPVSDNVDDPDQARHEKSRRPAQHERGNRYGKQIENGHGGGDARGVVGETDEKRTCNASRGDSSRILGEAEPDAVQLLAQSVVRTRRGGMSTRDHTESYPLKLFRSKRRITVDADRGRDPLQCDRGLGVGKDLGYPFSASRRSEGSLC
jgi:hypothetical protein